MSEDRSEKHPNEIKPVSNAAMGYPETQTAKVNSKGLVLVPQPSDDVHDPLVRTTSPIRRFRLHWDR